MAYDHDSDARKKQEEDKRKSRRVYSTALIDELIKERNMGYDIPYDAFFMRDLDLRAPNVTFRMTDEEFDTLQERAAASCMTDSEYLRRMIMDNLEKHLKIEELAHELHVSQTQIEVPDRAAVEEGIPCLFIEKEAVVFII